MIYPLDNPSVCVVCKSAATRLMLFKRPVSLPTSHRFHGLVSEFATVCDRSDCVERVLADPEWTWAAAPNKDAVPL